MGEDVPIILLTAYDWLDIEEEAKEAGVTAFCSKPLFYSELHKCLYSIMCTEEEEHNSREDKMSKRHTGRILLAEDNELNQEIAQFILEDFGMHVTIANNGKEAVEIFEQAEPETYQIIFMDVMMPVMNGYEAAKAIRSMSRPDAAQIPIVTMTANAFAEDVQAAKDAGMNEHIAKPLEADVIAQVLAQWLGK